MASSRKRRIDLGTSNDEPNALNTQSPPTKAQQLVDDQGRPLVNPLTGKPFSRSYYDIRKQRVKLPVWQYLDDLEEKLDNNQVVVVEGETGSGKTTQIPQFLVHSKFGRNSTNQGKMICCTQPRRVAAMSIASRVSDEMDVTLGEHVGYTIRFEDKTSQETRLK